jgi:plastocyanin
MSPRRSTARALAIGATLTVLVAGAAGCGSDSDPGSDSAAAATTATTTSAAAAPASASASASPSAELTPVENGVVTVAYKDYAIDPEEIVVESGQRVTWTNADTSRHNVVVKEGAPEVFKSRDFDQGETDTLTFTKPGVYEYLCTFHAASMQGKVTVQG